MESKDCWLKSNCKQLHCNDKNGCMILFKLNYLYNEANVPVNLRSNKILYPDSDGTDLNEFRQLKAIQDNILTWVNEGNNLLIYSKQCGNGKTSWSLKLLQAYFNKIWLNSGLHCRALFISVPKFLLALKDDITNKSEYIAHIKKNVANCDLVIWDDISSKCGTEFEISHLLSIIDMRISNGKANIYTSNVRPQDLSNYLDIRLASRIANYSTCIEFKGGDKRPLSVQKKGN